MEWWKGLAGLLVGEGLLEYQSIKMWGGSSFSAPAATGKGGAGGRENVLVSPAGGQGEISAMNHDEEEGNERMIARRHIRLFANI